MFIDIVVKLANSFGGRYSEKLKKPSSARGAVIVSGLDEPVES